MENRVTGRLHRLHRERDSARKRVELLPHTSTARGGLRLGHHLIPT